MQNNEKKLVLQPTKPKYKTTKHANLPLEKTIN